MLLKDSAQFEALTLDQSRAVVTPSGSGNADLLDAFRQELRQLGNTEGRNIVQEFRRAQGNADLLFEDLRRVSSGSSSTPASYTGSCGHAQEIVPIPSARAGAGWCRWSGRWVMRVAVR